VLAVAAELGIPTRERNFTLTDVYNAEEAFVTGTFAGLVPVTEVDGRRIGDGSGERPFLHRLRAGYRGLVQRYIEGAGASHPRQR
jgi:branched-chain amino acid aminotransferase